MYINKTYLFYLFVIFPGQLYKNSFSNAVNAFAITILTTTFNTTNTLMFTISKLTVTFYVLKVLLTPFLKYEMLLYPGLKVALGQSLKRSSVKSSLTCAFVQRVR